MQILEAGLEALGQFHAKGLISTDAEALILDQRAALDMVMDLVGTEQRELTPSYVKSLHQCLTLNQTTREVVNQSGNRADKKWPRSEKGIWKKWPNNPLQPDGSIHEYSPPEQVDSEIDQLLSWRKQHESLGVCAEVEAAWLHHRFAQIHPFIDGNGRVARALSSAVFLKDDYLVLVVRDEEHRGTYIDALKAADKGDLKPLVDLFADVQLSDLQAALKTIRELRGEEAIRAVEAAAAAARRSQDAVMDRIAGTLDELARLASIRLEEVAAETQRAFESQRVVVSTYVSDDEGSEHWWYRQIVEAAKQHDYFANLERPRRWASLKLGLPSREETDTSLVISLHGAGRRAGRHAVTAFLTQRLEDGDWDIEVVPGAAFFFDAENNSGEALEEVKAQFRVWLDEVIPAGIRAWMGRL